jgi:hypothetical protein
MNTNLMFDFMDRLRYDIQTMYNTPIKQNNFYVKFNGIFKAYDILYVGTLLTFVIFYFSKLWMLTM